MQRNALYGLSLSACALAGFAVCGAAQADDWPQWRGPAGTGAADSGSPPTQWSEQENVRWKVAVPGAGSSSPILLGDRVYVTTAMKTDRTVERAAADAAATPTEETPAPAGGRRGGRRFGGGPAPTNYYAFMVMAYDRASGEELWRTTVTEQVPHESGHETNTFASSSPVTDGQRLYVSFGSRGVYCLDLDGKVLWSRDLGRMQTRAQFGEGSSATVYDGRVVVTFDHEGDSFIVALNAKNGDELWRQPRDEPTNWATPLITEFDGRTQVITNGSPRVRSYDLATGELLWECGGQAQNPIPTPVRCGDNVIAMTGFRGYAIYSIPLDSQGDVTGSSTIAWSADDAASYVPSPALYQGQLYFIKANNGILMARDAETGDVVIKETRLPEITSVYASPVAADGRVYVTGRDGTTVVLKHGSQFEVLAVNKLDDEIDGSAAVADGALYLRGKNFLYCIAAD
jgi:outer membrane protein assembly factor BamB